MRLSSGGSLMFRSAVTCAAVLASATAFAQTSSNPFPTPIESTAGVVAVKFAEFATLPDVNGETPRMMHMIDETGTKRLFVSTMQGPIFSVSYDGKSVTEYVNVNAPQWKIGVQFQGSER